MSDETAEERSLTKHYLWLIRFGPWALSILGAFLLLFSLFADRDATLLIPVLVVGAVFIVTGMLLPRAEGAISMTKTGIEAKVQPVRDLEATVAEVATSAAEKAIPNDDPEKDRRVQEVVADAVQSWGGAGTLAGTWWCVIPPYREEPEKIDLVDLRPAGENLVAKVRRTKPVSQDQRRWEFVGKVRGNFLFGMFYTQTPDINALSYGTVQLYRENAEGTAWGGFYVRLEINAHRDGWSEQLEPIPLSWTRSSPYEIQ